MKKEHRLAAAGLLILTAGSSELLAAGKNNPSVALSYSPQQAVATAVATIAPEMIERPVAVRFRDGRPGTDATRIGTRTDDDDRTHVLEATTDVLVFVEETSRQVFAQWGLQVDPEAQRVVELTLMAFQITETNQAVGASFQGEVRFTAEVQNLSGQRLGGANVVGDASRYGRKFSNDNVNEVLSDALLEALANVVSEGAVQAAWAGDNPAPVSTTDSQGGTAREAISPSALLVEVERLIRQGLSNETIRSYVSQQVLDRALSANDLADWKGAGVPEAILQSALACKVL